MRKTSLATTLVLAAAGGAVSGAVYGTIGAHASRGKQITRATLVSAGAGALIAAAFAGIYYVAKS